MMWRALAAFCVSGVASSVWAQPCLPTVIVQGTGATVRVEEALTPKQRTRGLMYRSELKRGTGMWFVFEQDKPRSFWMRNTQIPLDIVYINAAGEIVRVVKNATPYSERGLPSGAPARYVLEVNAGEAEPLGLVKGGRVTTCGTPGPKVP